MSIGLGSAIDCDYEAPLRNIVSIVDIIVDELVDFEFWSRYSLADSQASGTTNLDMPKREIDAWLVQSLNIQSTVFLLVGGYGIILPIDFHIFQDG